MEARTSWRASSVVLASAIFVYRKKKQKKRASLIDEKKNNLNSIPKRKASLKMQNSLNTNERLKTQIVHME